MDGAKRTETILEEVHSEHPETVLYCEHEQALEQVAQRGSRISFLGDIKNCSWATGSRCPCLSRGVGPDDI